MKRHKVFGYNWKYILIHPWVFLEKFWEESVFAWQRIFRGWDDRSVWSIDFYLAKIIPEMVRELKEKEKGVPAEMFDEDDWDNENCYYKDGSMEQAVAKWETILDEIAEGFEEYYVMSNSLYVGNPLESEKFNRAFDLFRKYFGNLWW